VATAFGVGLALGGELPSPDRERPLRILGTLAVSATGLLDVAARRLGFGAGDPRAATFEYGTTFLLTAGVMNALLVLDVLDVAAGRKP
jgi:uncharacterized protein DUF6677